MLLFDQFDLSAGFDAGMTAACRFSDIQNLLSAGTHATKCRALADEVRLVGVSDALIKLDLSGGSKNDQCQVESDSWGLVGDRF
jgi:hypothetical protein